MSSEPGPTYGQSTAWKPERPRLRLFPLLLSWLATGVALMVAAGILPGVHIDGFWGALLVAAIVAALNAVIPPLLAALRLPLTLVLGFLLVLIADAAILLIADAVTDGVLRVDNFGWALLASLVVAAVSVVIAVFLGSDDTSSIRIAQRIARRQGIIGSTDVPGIVFLEIDGLALPVLRRAMRDGNAPNMARWLADNSHRLVGVGDRPLLADGRQSGGDPAGLERGHLGLPLGGEGDREADDVLGTRRTARRSSGGVGRASGCSSTAAPAAETCSPARRRT